MAQGRGGGGNYKGPLDYIDVATRIATFRQEHPEGVLSRIAPDGTLVPIEFREFGGKTWVVYTAFAYRSPEDVRPGVGTAWEPVPGATNFTRDSEVQNAETAAWGRAMVAALAADTRQGIASSEEVRNRQESAPPTPSKRDIGDACDELADADSGPKVDALLAAWPSKGLLPSTVVDESGTTLAQMVAQKRAALAEAVA